MFPKYYFNCKLQVYGEVECRSLHPELKSFFTEEKKKNDVDNHQYSSATPVQRRFISGKVVWSEWNSINKIFRFEKGTNKLIPLTDEGSLEYKGKKAP